MCLRMSASSECRKAGLRGCPFGDIGGDNEQISRVMFITRGKDTGRCQ